MGRLTRSTTAGAVVVRGPPQVRVKLLLSELDCLGRSWGLGARSLILLLGLLGRLGCFLGVLGALGKSWSTPCQAGQARSGRWPRVALLFPCPAANSRFFDRHSMTARIAPVIAVAPTATLRVPRYRGKNCYTLLTAQRHDLGPIDTPASHMQPASATPNLSGPQVRRRQQRSQPHT